MAARRLFFQTMTALCDIKFLNPNGIPAFSLGLRAERYPASTSQTRPNPEWVASHPRRAHAPRFNPFRVDDSSSRPPKVAPPSQPWAEGCNPFGIGAPIWSAVTCHRFPAGRLVARPGVTSPAGKRRRQVAALQGAPALQGGARLRRAVTAPTRSRGASRASISAHRRDAQCVRLAALVRRLDGVSPHLRCLAPSTTLTP